MNTEKKRFVSIAEYQRQSGLSYATIKHMIETGQLKYIVTEAGHERIDTQENTDTTIICKRLDVLETIITAIAEQLHTPLEIDTSRKRTQITR